MEGLLATPSASSAFSKPPKFDSKDQSDLLVIEATLDLSVKVSVSYKSPGKALGITASSIVKKINELLKDKLPEGIESLKSEEHTPEATSTRIVQGVTAFYGIFRQQHPELSDQEALKKFIETAKSGVQKGYDEAFEILKGFGAFEVEGVQAGVEQTKILIDQKLDAFYRSKLDELEQPKEPSPE